MTIQRKKQNLGLIFIKKNKVTEYLKCHDISLDEIKKLPNEDNENYLLQIKEPISSLPRNFLSEDLNELESAQKSVCGDKTVYQYERFSKEWTKKRN